MPSGWRPAELPNDGSVPLVAKGSLGAERAPVLPEQLGALAGTAAEGDGRVAEGVTDIVSSWIDFDEEPSEWEASYQPYAVDGDRAVAVGTSRYFGTGDDGDEVYYNCFLLRFVDGRCAEFTEYWMLEPVEG